MHQQDLIPTTLKITTVRARPGRVSGLCISHSKNTLSAAFLYGRAGRLTAPFGGFRPGQEAQELLRSLTHDAGREGEGGVPGGFTDPLGVFLRTAVPSARSILRAFRPP